MRTLSILVLGFLVVFDHNVNAQAHGQRAVIARASIEAVSTGNVATQSASTPTGDINAGSNSREVNPNASITPSLSGSKSSSAIFTPSAQPAIPSLSSIATTATPTASSAALTTNDTIKANPNELPIPPTITPALSVAGAFLMITGVLYTLIGIKTKWIHIFFSTAYLVSLAVTVLIVYVMHPPVTNAVQGAYFVAAFATGTLFGGGSVVFADLTEGLGCLLGGFCVSMWFLELRPGGLIRSTIGKVIFIACFTLGAYAFYVSHHTRPYGLIGSISFAGATVIVLGIDCFSRAGLKEFWLYIWNLNDAMLPPHYHGQYPITRGMRVEIAATVLIFLIGIMSQLKVWKMVKKHREQKVAAHIEQEKRKEESERNIGKELEEGTRQERMTWEAVYGDQAHGEASPMDSGVDSETTATPRKASTSVDETENNESKSEKGVSKSMVNVQEPPRVTVRVASEDSIYELPSATSEHLSMAHTEDTHAIPTTGLLEDPPEESRGLALSSSGTEAAPKGPDSQPNNLPGPAVVPLPFNVTGDNMKQSDDSSSIATSGFSDRLSNRLSKKLSGSSIVRNLSKKIKRRSYSPQAMEGGYVIPPNDDDQATSVAATLDFADHFSSNGEGLTDQHTPNVDEVDMESTSWPLVSGNTISLAGEDLNRAQSHVSDIRACDQDSCANPVDASVAKGDNQDASPQEPEASTNLRDHLSIASPKVVTAYRTNEWAKHLEQAEAPKLEALPKLLNGPEESPIMTESAAPVHVHQLQQTALTAEPAPLRLNTNADLLRSKQTHPDFLAPSSRSSLPSQRQYQPPVPVKSSLRRSSHGKPFHRAPSQKLMHHPSVSRRSSAPLVSSPLAQSPIEEGVESSFLQRDGRTTSRMPTHTLMAQRTSKLQNRYSATSLTRTSSSQSLSPVSPLDDQGPENPTLAHRKSLLQRPFRRSSGPTPTPRTSGSYSPYRQSPTDPGNGESIASAWRTSLRHDSSANILSEQQMDAKRSELLAEKRRTSMGAQAAEGEVAKRTSQRDGGMRRGDMLERHKEAMKRMQASVEL